MAEDSPISSEFIESQLLRKHDIGGLFSLRNGGISPAPFDSQNFGLGLGDRDANIEKNLIHFIQCTALSGLPHQATQTHHTDTLWCSGPGFMHTTEADILLSDAINSPLAIRTADCLPILLADPVNRITAAVHAGWRGTASRIVKHAIQAMCKHGSKAEQIVASLGPCIGPCCFNIGREAATALKNSADKASSFVQSSADLRQINRLQLLESGLSKKNIELINACTACDNKRFFSFRRDAGMTGRHIAVVAIQSKP